MNKQYGITEFLLKHADEQTTSFHMPGHKGSDLYRKFGYSEFLDKIMDCDITEIRGADNLFQTEGIIKSVQDKYKDLYGALHSYLLINGTSGGIIASILATVSPGGKLIMARNCHKSVFNALTLGNIQPVYAYPELVSEYGISGEISCAEIERCITENPDAEAVILPSPNYYGVCSDIAAIAEVVQRHGKILIVDQAHGAHLKFFEYGMPPAAEESGADIAINSIHKTLASFTQSAVLNLNSQRVDRYALEDKLQCIQSTSPSYLLMASLDINASILMDRGNDFIGRWADDLDYFYGEIAKYNDTEQPNIRIISNLCNFDRSKINIDSTNLGISAEELEDLLMEENIFCELTTGNILMLMTGIGNKRADYEKLIEALIKISKHLKDLKTDAKATDSKGIEPTITAQSIHLPKKVPLYEIPKTRKHTALSDAEGYICASSIIPYPPGIPLVCPGERFEADAIEYIKTLRKSGQKVIGVNEEEQVITGLHRG